MSDCAARTRPARDRAGRFARCVVQRDMSPTAPLVEIARVRPLRATISTAGRGGRRRTRHRTQDAACTTSKDTTLRLSLLNSTATRWIGWFRCRYLSANPPPPSRADAAASPARPVASTAPAHRRSMSRKRNPRPPITAPIVSAPAGAPQPRCALPPASLYPPRFSHAFTIGRAKWRHLDRDSSALAPASNPATATPIPP